MSDEHKRPAGQSPTPTPKDLVAYLLGKATPDQVRSIRAELDNPASEVNHWVRGVESWLEEAFPVRRDATTGRTTRDSEAMQKLNDVLEYARGKLNEEVISREEFDRIRAVGYLDGIERFPRTPAEAIAATARIVQAIRESHPELADELAKFQSALSR